MDEKTCGCATPAAETVSTEASEPVEAVYEEGASDIIPWLNITRDPTKFRQCMATAAAHGPMKSAKAIYELIKDEMVAQDQETFCVVPLDTQLQIKCGFFMIAKGARDRTLAPLPDILRVAILSGAMGIVVAHNHPSGKSNPSEADKRLTKDIEKACRTIHIPLFDHIVVGLDSYFSFADHNLISK